MIQSVRFGVGLGFGWGFGFIVNPSRISVLQMEKMMMFSGIRNSIASQLVALERNQIRRSELGFWFSNCRLFILQRKTFSNLDNAKVTGVPSVKCSNGRSKSLHPNNNSIDEQLIKKTGKKGHHLWKKRDSAGSGQKALNLVRIVSELPNEKEAVYGALDKWIAWEVEFPLVAAATALRILKKRSQWTRVIQVAKWMLSKGQGATMGTYDSLLLAFDMDRRVDEAESLWNMILHTQTRSISKQLFSRIISLYDHHSMQDKIIEVFADMEELGVKPDEDTVKRVARSFENVGQEEKRNLVLKKYLGKSKYIHFNGERVRVKRDAWDER